MLTAAVVAGVETCGGAAACGATVTVTAGVEVLSLWDEGSEEAGAETTAEVILL